MKKDSRSKEKIKHFRIEMSSLSKLDIISYLQCPNHRFNTVV